MRTWADRAKAACSPQHLPRTSGDDESPIPKVVSVLAVPTEADSKISSGLSSLLAVTIPAAAEKKDAVPVITESKPTVEFCKADVQEKVVEVNSLIAEDHDRWSWPHSSALNSAEIDLFHYRLKKFKDKGLNRDAAEMLVDRLVIRDRGSDHRRLCLECRHLTGYGPPGWQCGNWQAAGTAINARNAGPIPSDLVCQLQQCSGFGHIRNV